ncbi:hypothetical protein [Sediminibacillus massiliensis]|uniref:hypothetical protein n=1 Tax=Sediminibacillus massiliensis TaxID=1926277 RepID=UPI0009887F61|nr:hypothetical protein [Sediminibacillus massiliensis]
MDVFSKFWIPEPGSTVIARVNLFCLSRYIRFISILVRENHVRHLSGTFLTYSEKLYQAEEKRETPVGKEQSEDPTAGLSSGEETEAFPTEREYFSAASAHHSIRKG